MNRLIDAILWKQRNRREFRKAMQSGYGSELSSLLSWFEEPLQLALRSNTHIIEFLSSWKRIKESAENLKRYNSNAAALHELDQFLFEHLDELEKLLTKQSAIDTKVIFHQKREAWRYIKSRVNSHLKKTSAKLKRKRREKDDQNWPPIPVPERPDPYDTESLR